MAKTPTEATANAPQAPPPEPTDITNAPIDNDSDSDDADFDPTAPAPGEAGEDSDSDDEGTKGEDKVPDYSHIGLDISLVKTRSQRYQETNKKLYGGGLVRGQASVDIDSIFNELKSGTSTGSEWLKAISEEPTPAKPTPATPPPITNNYAPETITIKSTYAFAGRIVTETKTVDANSAEAKAYLNSTSHVAAADGEERPYRLFVPVVRKVPGQDEPVELRIKLKRPSLIDKFLATSGKKIKLSTLEKSRLDWASFVDKRQIQDELKIGNKAGYLEKQDFLGRLQSKRDENYQAAKDEERRKKFLQQQGQ